MGNGIWYPAYSLDRLLAVAVPSEPRATWLAVALALLLVFVTRGCAGRPRPSRAPRDNGGRTLRSASPLRAHRSVRSGQFIP